MLGIMGDIFDFDHSGKIDPLEQALELAALQQIMDEEPSDDSDITDESEEFDAFDDL